MRYALAVFLATAVVDALWTRYIQHTAERRAGQAASYSALLVLCGAFSTVAIVDQHWLAIPAAAGAFVGTYLTARL